MTTMKTLRNLKVVNSLAIFNLLFIFFNASSVSGETSRRSLGVELESLTDSKPSEFLTELRETTTKHINNFFQGRYDSPETKILLDILKYEKNEPIIDSMTETFMARVDFQGVSIYTDGPIITEEEVEITLIGDAFRGQSRLDYVTALQKSSNRFLADIQSLSIYVDGSVIAHENNISRIHIQSMSQSEVNVSMFGQDIPLYAVITAAIALLVCVTIGLFLLILRRRRRNNSLRDKVNTAVASVEEQYSCRGIATKMQEEMEAPTKSESTDLELASTRSPSPIKSITSQESSIFTYNPQSKAGTKDYGMSDVSNSNSLRVKTQPSFVHVRNSQKESMISPMTPAFVTNFSCNISNKRAQKPPTEKDRKENEITQKPKMATERSKPKEQTDIFEVDDNAESSSLVFFVNDSADGKEGVEVEGSFLSDTSDVINDLKNLSKQIDQYRNNYT